MKTALQFVQELPHQLHMTFSTPSALQLWAAVRPEYLTISSEDLTMKFGAAIDGIWTVIGILDGWIGKEAEAVPVYTVMDGVINTVNFMRQFVGRPLDHFGLTPIAIYSRVLGATEIEVADALSPDPGDAPQTD